VDAALVAVSPVVFVDGEVEAEAECQMATGVLVEECVEEPGLERADPTVVVDERYFTEA
jgi:hypothetical protein